MRPLPLTVIAAAALVLAACGARRDNSYAAYQPVAEIEAVYGPLIATGNHPTRDQNGTGERVGLFKDADGNVWGLPILVTSAGSTLACAPPSLRDAGATGTFPVGSAIIGATNEPTGWRGGTGSLELLLRDSHGAIHSQPVGGAQIVIGPACRAAQSPGPPQRLDYYRLVPSAQPQTN